MESSKQILTEDTIRDVLFKAYSNYADVVVTKWRGWTIYGTGGKGEKMPLRRELDIARFQRSMRQYLSPSITLTGYEVKGMVGTNDTTRFPYYGEGLDQAIALLDEGADYSYFVWPEPDDEIKKALETMISRYCPLIGILFVMNTKSMWEYRKAGKNTHTNDCCQLSWWRSLLRFACS
jgi:hypothetical protein